MHKALLTFLLTSSLWLMSSLPAEANDTISVESRQQADTLLDKLHQDASNANWDSYFSLYDEKAVFLGTDATERWDMSQFAGYARPTDGWHYEVKSRQLLQFDNTIVFDELLHSASYGLCRGTGALQLTENGWKIVQYHLSIAIPNENAKAVAKLIGAR
ncbi:nuclear transport factor 2 family protein [Shewanella sp. 10N.7]|uniref:nuclear transport factor 2 family protein n=1 Tax=Shewanella sp. 10N.7 TaxID=2885093 RepID=UPI001E43A241|nr:nuclear transport factor 2 family protein [Shewanella sp. 10N.7]MCC4833179.1 nuclear transport factor 2 family protein [Shewanella sp. 10N.7]